MQEEITMNTGTRAGVITIIGSEMVGIITDARWMLLAITICVIADFRYGWGESSKRYTEAKEKHDRLGMAQYKWRTSRAIRRTINKLIDYVIWVTLGMFFGIAVLKPFNIDYIFGGVAVTAIAIACEAKSFFGHFIFLHGVTIQQNTITGFLKSFIIALAKRKNRDVGEAIEEGFNEVEKESKKDENN